MKHKFHLPFEGLLMLFCLMFCSSNAKSSEFIQNPPKKLEASSFNDSLCKSEIYRCANFGKVECENKDAGGVIGNLQESKVIQCFNTGNLNGDQRIGGISGYVSANSNDSSFVKECSNYGLIQGNSNIGGIAGYINSYSLVNSSLNVGNVSGNIYVGAIAGRKFSSSSKVQNCFYDNQMCLVKGINGNDTALNTNGRVTKNLIGDSLAIFLGRNYWTYSTNYYPMLNFMNSSTAAISAASPIFLNNKETIDSVKTCFSVQNGQNIYWKSNKPNSLLISGANGIILKNDTDIVLMVGDSLRNYKQLKIRNIIYNSPEITLYDTICDGDGYYLNGFQIAPSLMSGLSSYMQSDTLKNVYGQDSIVTIVLQIKPVYSIAFNANLGIGKMDSIKICGKQKIQIPSSKFSRTNYVFAGWAYDSLGSLIVQSGDSIFISSNTTLYAIWNSDGSDSANAIHIDNLQDLIAFRNAVNDYKNGVYKGIANQSSGYKNKYFLMTDDINLDSLRNLNINWTPIGLKSTSSFRGNFNGGGHIISNLYINAPAEDHKGLFGYIDSAVIEKVILSVGDSLIGRTYCGGIVGYMANNSVVRNCANHAYVKGTSSSTGGICGHVAKSSVYECYNTGNIKGNEKVGGIAGYVNGGNNNSYITCNIRYCYNSGQIEGNEKVGGIIGNTFAHSNISQVYSSGQITADTVFGSVIGLKSNKSHVIQYVYYDKQISPVGGIKGVDDTSCFGLLTTELINPQRVIGFDTTHWSFDDSLYPKLSCSDSGIATKISLQPIFLNNADNSDILNNSFSLSGCDYIQWTNNKPLSLDIKNCSANVLQSDSNLIIYAYYGGLIYKTIKIKRIIYYIPNYYTVTYFADNGTNDTVMRKFPENTKIALDSIKFTYTNHILLGWSPISGGNLKFYTNDSITIVSDTSLHAIWGNDGLSAAYALSIDSLEDFINFRNAVNNYVKGYYKGVSNNNTGFSGIYFSLDTSINLSSCCDSTHSWEAIGKNTTCNFKGHFDGKSHTVDYLYIDSASHNYCGLFGCIDSAEIKQITLGAHSYIRANKYVGGIVAYARKHSVLQACANLANIYAYGECVGGICGYLQQSTVKECYNDANIHGKEKVGGIVGYATSSVSDVPSVSYCYNSNAIAGNKYIGGLIGYLSGHGSLVKAYNSGQLFGETYTGSIIGRKYGNESHVENCFYDKQISNIGGINGKDAEKITEAKFTKQMLGNKLNNDLDSMHWSYTDNFYPRLNCQGTSDDAWISVVPVFLQEPECLDMVTHSFYMGSYKDLSWESNSNSIRIVGNQVFLLDSDSSVIIDGIYDDVCRKRFIFQEIIATDAVENISENKMAITAYPNPTKNIINIEVNKQHLDIPYLTRVFDSNGRILLEQTQNNNIFSIDLSELPKGCFYISILCKNKKTSNIKIVKQ